MLCCILHIYVHCVVLYYCLLFCIVLYLFVCYVLFCIALYCIFHYIIVLCSLCLYYIALHWIAFCFVCLYILLLCSVLYIVIEYCALLYVILYSILYCIVYCVLCIFKEKINSIGVLSFSTLCISFGIGCWSGDFSSQSCRCGSESRQRECGSRSVWGSDQMLRIFEARCWWNCCRTTGN